MQIQRSVLRKHVYTYLVHSISPRTLDLLRHILPQLRDVRIPPLHDLGVVYRTPQVRLGLPKCQSISTSDQQVMTEMDAPEAIGLLPTFDLADSRARRTPRG